MGFTGKHFSSSTPAGVAGSGVSGINYIENSDAETNTTGWVTYKDVAGVAPVDGSGGTAAITFTRSTTTPLRDVASFLLTRTGGASRQGEGASYEFTVDAADKAKVLQIEFDYILASGTFVAGSSTTTGDLNVYIYDVTNATIIQPSSFKLLSNSTTVADKFVANFQTSANGSVYRLIFHVATATTAEFALEVDSVKIGPCNYVYGTPITDLTSYTPTVSGLGTGSGTATARWRRVGDSVHIYANFVKDGSNGTNAGQAVTFSLPSGLTIDTAKLPNTNRTAVGTFFKQTATTPGNAAVVLPSTYGNTFFVSGNFSNIDAVGSDFGANTIWSAEVIIPISGWSSSVQMSDSYSSREISAYYTGTVTGTLSNVFNTITYPTRSNDTTNSYSGGTYTIPSSGFYDVAASVQTNQNWTANNSIGIGVFVDGTSVASNFNRAPVTTNYVFQVAVAVNSIYLRAGQLVTIRAYTDGTGGSYSESSSGVNYFSIAKQQAPTTISATEVVAARYTLASTTAIGTSAAVLPYLTLGFDTHSAYSTGTGLYTCPVAGLYQINAAYTTVGVSLTTSQGIDLYIRRNGSDVDRRLVLGNGASVNYNANLATIVQCNAGDTLGVFAASAVATTAIASAPLNVLSISRIK